MKPSFMRASTTSGVMSWFLHQDLKSGGAIPGGGAITDGVVLRNASAAVMLNMGSDLEVNRGEEMKLNGVLFG